MPKPNKPEPESSEPWRTQRPGFENLMPLANAVAQVERCLIEHGDALSQGRHVHHQSAHAEMNPRVETVQRLWEERKAQASPYAVFGQSFLESLDHEVKGWLREIFEAERSWRGWSGGNNLDITDTGTVKITEVPGYSDSELRRRTRQLIGQVQEFEKRLHRLQETADDNRQAESAAPDRHKVAGLKKAADWKPPQTHIGSIEITTNPDLKKNGKPIPTATLHDWKRKDLKSGKLKEAQIKRAPDNQELYYPRSWVAKRYKQWTPRPVHKP